MNKFEYKVQGVDYEVEIEEMEGNIAKVSVNGIPFEVELKQPINPAKAISRPKVAAPAPAPAAAPAARPAAPAASAGAGTAVKAPLPGTITTVNVKVGDKVNVGDTVVVLEAMKMQNNIEAECAGTITAILVNPGDSVMEGASLVTIG
ncbi:MAG: biotin/lipoyl-containing protein [Prevotella sp.]